jgi:hypothetical protein
MAHALKYNATDSEGINTSTKTCAHIKMGRRHEERGSGDRRMCRLLLAGHHRATTSPPYLPTFPVHKSLTAPGSQA